MNNFAIHLALPGVTVKPYVRMTRRGKFVDPQAQEYLASKATLSMRIKEEMINQGNEILPGQTPLQIVIRLSAPNNPGHKCDLDNQIKAILDSCNGIAFPDDRWVDDIDARRFIGDNPFLMLSITRLD